MSDAVYPGSLKSYADHVNVTEIIDASHPNAIQAEVTAIENVLGYGANDPRISTVPTAVTNFTFASYTGPNAPQTVHQRLSNLEKGVVSDSHTQYVKNAGGSTVIPVNSSTKGIVVKAISGQSVNLMEFQDSSGSVATYIDKDGILNGAISSGITTSKGDLIVGGSSGAPARFGVGANGTILTADSTKTNGVTWATAPNQTIGYSYAFLMMGA